MSKMFAQAWQIAQGTSGTPRGKRRHPSQAAAGNQVGLYGTKLHLRYLNSSELSKGFFPRNCLSDKKLAMAYTHPTVPFIEVIAPIWSSLFSTSWSVLAPLSCLPFCQQHRAIFPPGLFPVCPHGHRRWYPHSEAWQPGGKQGPFQIILTPLFPRAVCTAVLVKG